MNRTAVDSISQLVRRHETKPPRLKTIIHRVHYMSRRITVGARGYGILRRVSVQQGIDLGTPDAQLVVSGNTAWLERQPDGSWLCVSIRTKTRCATGSATDEVEIDTEVDTSIGYTVNKFSDTIVPDTLFYSPFETLGMLTLPTNRPPLPNFFCVDTPPQQPNQVLCFNAVDNCFYWCDPSPIPPVQGDGSMAYVATSLGVARGTNLLTTPSWIDVSTGLAGAALDVVDIKFDPYSTGVIDVISGTQALTKMWAMTKDGIYYGTGLPNTVTWTQQLSLAEIATLLTGVGVGDPAPTDQLLTFIQHEGLVAIAVAKEHTPSNFFGQEEWRFYLIYSLDFGANWSVDTSKFTSTFAPYEEEDDWQSTITFTPSDHLYDVIYATASVGNQTTVAGQNCAIPGGGWNSNLQKVTGVTGSWAFYSHLGAQSDQTGLRFLPLYTNAAGGVLSDDEQSYIYSFIATSWRGFAYRAVNNVLCTASDNATYFDDAGMDNPTRLVDFCTFSPNSIYLAVRDGVTNTDNLFSSADGGVTWDELNANAFMLGTSALPSNALYCLWVGRVDVGDSELKVWLTLDNGVTIDDVGNNNEISTVLGLGGTDYARRIKPDAVYRTP